MSNIECIFLLIEMCEDHFQSVCKVLKEVEVDHESVLDQWLPNFFP